MKSRFFVMAIAALAAISCNCSTDKSVHKSHEELNMPIIQTKYTADPAPIVIGDTLFLYTSHDDDHGENFIMKDWLLYTTTEAASMPW